jgi:hypothetical protein
MKKAPPSPESVQLARIAFGQLTASPGTLITSALPRLGLRKLSDWPYSKTRLLLQAAHQVNTRT